MSRASRRRRRRASGGRRVGSWSLEAVAALAVAALGAVAALAMGGPAFFGVNPLGIIEDPSPKEATTPAVTQAAPTIDKAADERRVAEERGGKEAKEKAAEEEAAERAAERAAAERAAAEKAVAEQAAARRQAAAEQYAAERAAAEQYAAEQATAERQYAAEQAAAEEQYAAEVAPADTAMRLSVPKLGISGAQVVDGEAGLELGAMHLPGTGFPWIAGSNTYIAGHRIGFPGTGSDHIFYSLPSLAPGDAVVLTDSNDTVYEYRVSEIFAVTPFDTWVTGPTGSDTVTLQVCTETPDDWWTIGPRLMSSGPESGRLIVRAERVA